MCSARRRAHLGGAVVLLRDGRHPWVISLLIGCVISGVFGLLRTPDPRIPIDSYVPPTWRAVYYALLAAAGLVTLVGVFLPDLRDRLMVEQIGLWFLTGPLIVYPLAVLTLYGVPFSLGTVISSLIGVGGLARIAEIIVELRAWREAA